MQKLAVLLIVIGFAVVSFAQSSSAPKLEEVSIISAYSGHQAFGVNTSKSPTGPVRTPYAVPDYGDNRTGSPPPAGSVAYYEQSSGPSVLPTVPRTFINYANVVLQNNTGKLVVAVKYSFFVVRNADGKILKTSNVEKKLELYPRQQATVSKGHLKGYSGVSYSAKITQVKYSDGSVWIP